MPTLKPKLNLSTNRSNLLFTMVLTVLIFASIGTYLILSSKASPTIASDFNNDGTVNIFDLSILASNWNRTNATNTTGDANNDGTVNIFDLSILASQWGQSGNPGNGTFSITSLSTSHARIGATLTINGRGFGSARSSSTVTFGETQVSNPTPAGEQKWAPVTKEAASYVSWSDTQIVVTVPSMSPGLEGYPGTYHNVRVYVAGVESNAANFYIDPDVVNPSSADYIAWSAVGSEYNWRAVPRTPNSNTTNGVQGYDYVADNSAWLGNHIRGRNIVFMNSTFTANNPNINGDYGGVITVGQGQDSYNVTFVNCTFKENWSTNNLGGGIWHGVNGVKIVTPAHDITISDSTFERFSRMSYEVISWGEDIRYLSVRNSIFEPPGNQVISFGAGEDTFSLIENCLFKGWGNHEVMYPDGAAAWEANQSRYIVTRNTEWWAGSTDPININQTPGRPSFLYFENCKMYADNAHRYALQRKFSHQWANMLAANGMEYSRWKNCYFYTGDGAVGIEYFGSTNWGDGPVQWAANNNYNDFSGSVVGGYINNRNDNIWKSPFIPRTIEEYFDPDSPLLRTNILPRIE